jgi:hypothetical protein
MARAYINSDFSQRITSETLALDCLWYKSVTQEKPWTALRIIGSVMDDEIRVF